MKEEEEEEEKEKEEEEEEDEEEEVVVAEMKVARAGDIGFGSPRTRCRLFSH